MTYSPKNYHRWRKALTPEELEDYKEKARERSRKSWLSRIQNETPQQREIRLQKHRAYRKKKLQDDPAYFRDRSFRSHHGVERDEADQMSTEQKGLCAICNQPPSGKGTNSRLHVDHCHTTGKIRGMLCHRCNTAIGLLLDDPAMLQSAIHYLQQGKT